MHLTSQLNSSPRGHHHVHSSRPVCVQDAAQDAATRWTLLPLQEWLLQQGNTSSTPIDQTLIIS